MDGLEASKIIKEKYSSDVLIIGCTAEQTSEELKY